MNGLMDGSGSMWGMGWGGLLLGALVVVTIAVLSVYLLNTRGR